MDNNEVTMHGHTTEDLDEILFFSNKAAKEEWSDVTPVELPELLKQNWIEESQKLWDLNDNEIKSRMKHEKMPSEIHVCGSVGEGYGAILRDSQMVSIAARSRSLPDSVSKSYVRLNAVALAAKLALDYQVLDFTLFVPSLNLYNIVTSIWNPYLEPESSHNDQLSSKERLMSLLLPEEKGNIEDIHRLTSSIIKDLELLRRSGIKYFAVQPIFTPDDNKAAEFLAKCEDRDMKFAEIFEKERLSDIVFEDDIS